MSTPNYSRSILFGFKYRWSEHEDLQMVYDTVWETLHFKKDIQRKTKARMKKYLKLFLANLLDAMHQEKCVAIHVRADEFSNGQYAKFYIKRRAFLPLKDSLIEAGWIDSFPGFRAMTYENIGKIFISPKNINKYNVDDEEDEGYDKGALTRIWGTPKLHKLFADVINLPEKEASPLVVLRDKDGNDIEFEENDFTTQERNDIELINQVYKNNYFIFKPDVFETLYLNPYNYDYWEHFDAIHGYIGPYNMPWEDIDGIKAIKCSRNPNFRKERRFHPRLTTTFNNSSFAYGGRLYAKPIWGESWQSMPQIQRKYIRINGEQVVELDYSSQHLAIAYALVGKQLQGDPYNIPGFEDKRGIIKKLTLTLINASNEAQAVSVMNSSIFKMRKTSNRKGPFITYKNLKFLIDCNNNKQNWNIDNKVDWVNVINILKEKHHDIRRYICSGAGSKFQRIDSIIMRRVVMHFAEQGIPCLPVHDSVIIAKKYEAELSSVMKKVFYNVTRFNCGVEKKITNTRRRRTYFEWEDDFKLLF